MCFVAMLECSSLVSCCIRDGIVLLIAELCHSCFACHLQTVHPFLAIFISISTEIISSFQWHTWFSKLRPGSCISFWSTHMHCISHLAYHVMFCIMLLAHCTMVDCCFPCLWSCLGLEPGDEYVIEEPVENTYKDQACVNSENFAGKMNISSKSLLSLLASCSLYCYAYDAIPTTCYIIPPILPCQASNPPFLANRCLAMLPLCSAPLIALLVAGEDWSLFLVGTCLLLGYHYYILSILMLLYTW